MKNRLKPPQILILAALIVIITGTALLSLDISASKERLSLVDSLFTATSGVCVTGLIVVDTGADLSIFGQCVLLILIQIGGLGLMTFGTFFAVLLGNKIAFRDRALMQSSYLASPQRDLLIIIKHIIFLTIFIEAGGALLLFLKFYGREGVSMGQAIFRSIFHSVSAFCNAGFSLFSNSFMDYNADAYFNSVIMALIIAGGLGFLVLIDIKRNWKVEGFTDFRKLTLHSKMVLGVTCFLLIMGTILIYILEREHNLVGKPPMAKFLSSLFLAVTPRTAGFNTLDTSKLTSATKFFVTMLMFIGGSPGSTAGGIKTTTIGIFWVLLLTRARGKKEINVFYRTIPDRIVGEAVSVVLISMLLIVGFSLALCITELNADSSSNWQFLDVFFETMSAFGTVGLSTGITPHLSTIGKLLLCVLMLVGRLGPLTIAFAVAGKEVGEKYKYPEEDLMIG